MAKRIFTVTAVWDDDAKVFYSKSDIDGLHIEAETLEQFGEVLGELGPEMVLANHLLRPENVGSTLSDIIPTIIWEKPVIVAA